MDSRRILFLCAVAALAVHQFHAVGSHADEPHATTPPELTVATRDGSLLKGFVDARSNEASLWLRREDRPIVLATPVAWHDIAAVRIAGADVSPAALREELAAHLSNGPRWAELFASPAAVAGEWATTALALPPIVSRRVRVRNIEVLTACLVNLDRDVEPDGIEATIAVVDESNSLVSVRGHLQATLFGERRPLLSSEVEFPELDRWTRRVRPEDFIDGTATYQFRFRNAAPQWEFDLMPDAVLSVQLGAAGQGNYAASSPVAIREFNVLRDDLQLYRGTRFLPNEPQGWRPQDPFGTQKGLWPVWWR